MFKKSSIVKIVKDADSSCPSDVEQLRQIQRWIVPHYVEMERLEKFRSLTNDTSPYRGAFIDRMKKVRRDKKERKLNEERRRRLYGGAISN